MLSNKMKAGHSPRRLTWVEGPTVYARRKPEKRPARSRWDYLFDDDPKAGNLRRHHAKNVAEMRRLGIDDERLTARDLKRRHDIRKARLRSLGII